MRKLDQYLSTIDTIYSDNYTRERVFSDMVDAAPFQAPPRNVLERLLGSFAAWRRKRASRLALGELSDEQLSDVGLTKYEATQELSKTRLLPWPSRMI